MRALLVLAVLALSALASAHAADPDALWKIVHGQCVPDQQANGKAAPCAEVDLWNGAARGTAVLKDLVGTTQFLLIPTARITGVEAPELLAPDAPNFFAAAWDARRFTAQHAKHALARDEIGLAINSEHGRTQDQLHIHIDCLHPEVVTALRAHAAALGDSWAPFPEPLEGRTYQAMRVREPDPLAIDPFYLLATGIPGAGADMGDWTLALVGAHFTDGDGFVLLADHADPATSNPGAAEELEDHACAIAKAPS